VLSSAGGMNSSCGMGIHAGAPRRMGAGRRKGSCRGIHLLNAVITPIWPGGNLPFALGELDCALPARKLRRCERQPLQRQLTTVYCSIRLTRMDVNRLFNPGRSGGAILCGVRAASNSTSSHLRWRGEHHQSVPARKGDRRGLREPGPPTAGPSTYCLYNPDADQVFFFQQVRRSREVFA